jgi:hypothetical protein
MALHIVNISGSSQDIVSPVLTAALIIILWRKVQDMIAKPIFNTTEADARKHDIPPRYSLKNWDLSEEPIILLGSVLDANSLGK